MGNISDVVSLFLEFRGRITYMRPVSLVAAGGEGGIMQGCVRVGARPIFG